MLLASLGLMPSLPQTLLYHSSMAPLFLPWPSHTAPPLPPLSPADPTSNSLPVPGVPTPALFPHVFPVLPSIPSSQNILCHPLLFAEYKSSFFFFPSSPGAFRFSRRTSASARNLSIHEPNRVF